MKEHIYNKLVRDNVPDIIREQGGTPVIRTLGDEEYVQCLENKLREEVGEFLEERTLDELGDIIEVLEELAHLQGWTDWEIRHARSEKAQRNGIFRERIFLEKVLEDGHEEEADMADFFNAALPFVAMGLTIALLAANGRRGRKNYLTEGMCLGLALGVGLADALHMELGLAMSLGMLLGAALGQLAPKGGKESSKEDDHETH